MIESSYHRKKLKEDLANLYSRLCSYPVFQPLHNFFLANR